MQAPGPFEIRKTLEKCLYDVLKPLGIRMSERNRKFDPKRANKWCRATVKLGRPITLEKGDDALGKRPGSFMVQIFAVPDSGVSELEKVCAKIEEEFRLKTVDDVHCEEPATIEVGVESGEAWYQINVIIPFWTWVGK